MKAKLRTAIIGLGGRGMGLMHTVLRMKDVEVVAVCDLYEDRVNKALAAISKRVGSARGETDYCKLLDKRNVDAMLVTTAWSAHSEIAFAAMEAGIPVGCEVGGAYSVEECFRLVEVSERTGTPYMMLENCCYGEYELACLNMVRQGLFGTVVNVEGGYKHDLRDEICYGEKNRHYRRRIQAGRRSTYSHRMCKRGNRTYSSGYLFAASVQQRVYSAGHEGNVYGGRQLLLFRFESGAP